MLIKWLKGRFQKSPEGEGIPFDQEAYERFDSTLVYAYLGNLKFDKVETLADYQKLTDGEKVIYPLLRLGLDMEVHCDFESFFEREGSWSKEIAGSLKRIGATAAYEEFLQAFELFFGGRDNQFLDRAREASFRESCHTNLTEEKRKRLFEMSDPFTAMIDPAVFMAFKVYEKSV